MSRILRDINICLGLLALGFVLEVVAPDIDLQPLASPVSGLLMVATLLMSVMAYLNYRDNAVVKRLMSRSMGVGIMVSLTLLVCMIGIIPQDRFMQMVEGDGLLRRLGLFSLKSSYPFILLSLLMLLSLGCVVVKYIAVKSRYGFIMWSGHLGLWLCFAAGIFGAADYKELRVSVGEGNQVGMAVNDKGQVVPLDFMITLNHFSVEYYPSGGAKHYASDVSVDGGKRWGLRERVIEVNHPLRMGSYFIYQTGHRQEGEEQISIFKVIYDPYIWMWYLGIALLILCSLTLFLLNFKLRQDELG